MNEQELRDMLKLIQDINNTQRTAAEAMAEMTKFLLEISGRLTEIEQRVAAIERHIVSEHP